MRSRRRREGMSVNGEINVVSLIDVMMLLMVIFMIAAPMMQGGVDINLPKGDAPALESKNALMVTIDKNGQIYVDDVKTSESDFNGHIKALATRKGKDGVYVRADGAVHYELVARLLSVMASNGITNFGLVMEPPPDSKQ